MRWLLWVLFKLQPCWLFGHRYVSVSKGRVGMCHRCQGFYRLGKQGRVLERLDGKGKVVDRAVRHAVRKGMETRREREMRREVARRVKAVREARAA